MIRNSMETTIPMRLEALRQIMRQENMDAFYISGTDPHRSEYLCDHWLTRQYISGFSGSYGEVVVTMESAGLWTDTRYFLQAEAELSGTGFTMHKLRVPEAVPVVQWLQQNLPPDARLGVDPCSLPIETYRSFLQELAPLRTTIVFMPDALPAIWPSRPPMPAHTIFQLEDSITGESRISKLDRITEVVRSKSATCTIISALDELAWTFNLRGSDIPFNPLFFGFALIGQGYRKLFVQDNALPGELREQLSGEGTEILPYSAFYDHAEKLNGETVYLDPSTANTAILMAIPEDSALLEGISVTSLMKAVKNGTELEGFRKAMINDGVAMLKLLHWLKDNVTTGELTEYTVAKKTAFFRSQQDGFRGESFRPIVGYRDHGAMVHLSVEEQNAYPIQKEGIVLLDSGGHYDTGTTDITRTVAVGRVTEQQKTDFTLVLQGMIRLSQAVFPAGTRGVQLDILARQALWEHCLNYGHGTGHGVGHYLNVHEGPASIRQEINPQEILPGMVFSNEPGIYRPGAYGIRTENLMVCVEKETTAFGRFLEFETLTLCPVDTSLLVVDMLLPAERGWFNAYHARVRETLMPHVPEELRSFLEELTRPV